MSKMNIFFKALPSKKIRMWLNIFVPGHPAELSDYVKLLLIDAKGYVFEINLV